MKLTTEASEIIKAKVDFVSLVDRPANRIPFRIMKKEGVQTIAQTQPDALAKEDTSMSIDLGRIGSLLFKSDTVQTFAPTVTAVLVSKSVGDDVATQLVKEAGFSTDKLSKNEDSLVFEQDAISKDDVLFRLSDDVAIMVGSLSKGFREYDFDATSFEELKVTKGFYPAMYLGLDMLSTAFSNVLQKSDTASDAKPLLQKSISEFASYMQALVDTLPEKAFKAERMAKSVALKKAATPVTPADRQVFDAGIAQSPMSSEADKPQEVRTESAEQRRVSADPGHRSTTYTDSAETGPAETQTPEANKQAAIDATGENADKNTNRNIDEERGSPADIVRDRDVAAATQQVANENVQAATGSGEIKPDTDDPELKLQKTLEKMFGGLTSELKTFQTNVEQRMATLEEGLKKTDKILSGTTVSHAPAEDVLTKSSARDKEPPLLDTALSRMGASD